MYRYLSKLCWQRDDAAERLLSSRPVPAANRNFSRRSFATSSHSFRYIRRLTSLTQCQSLQDGWPSLSYLMSKRTNLYKKTSEETNKTRLTWRQSQHETSIGFFLQPSTAGHCLSGLLFADQLSQPFVTGHCLSRRSFSDRLSLLFITFVAASLTRSAAISAVQMASRPRVARKRPLMKLPLTMTSRVLIATFVTYRRDVKFNAVVAYQLE